MSFSAKINNNKKKKKKKKKSSSEKLLLLAREKKRKTIIWVINCKLNSKITQIIIKNQDCKNIFDGVSNHLS